MDDVKTLLTRALPDRPALVEPAFDLARGHRALRRRRTALAAGGGTLAVAAVAAVTLVTVRSSDPARDTDFAKPPAPGTSARGAGSPTPAATLPPGQEAPDFTPGYAVSSVPDGWVVQGGTPQALTIARADDPDKDVSSFEGKLVVMLEAPDFAPPVDGTPQQVAGRPGYFRVEAASVDLAVTTATLNFQDAAGHWVTVQAPSTLGWDAPQLAQWAGGITVLSNAQPGLG